MTHTTGLILMLLSAAFYYAQMAWFIQGQAPDNLLEQIESQPVAEAIISIHETTSLRYACLMGAAAGGFISVIVRDPETTRKMATHFFASWIGGYVATPALFWSLGWEPNIEIVPFIAFAIALVFVVLAAGMVHFVDRNHAILIKTTFQRMIGINGKTNGNGSKSNEK